VANVGIGYFAGAVNTTGANNVAVGQQALYSNTTASNNTAVGYQAGYTNTTGNYLTAVGWSSLYSNTTGVENTAMGRYTLGSNTSGGYNVAVGNQALVNNTTASSNTAVGYQAGYANTTGNYNTFLGYQSGYNSNVSGNAFNTCIGLQAGYSLSSGTANTFIGVNSSGNGSGSAVTSGSKNTILGGYSGNQGGLDIRTSDGYIVLSDGDGNPRAYWDGFYTYLPSVYAITTAAGANVASISDGTLRRSTSALKYKKDIRDLEAVDISVLRPVRYKSNCEGDDQTKDHFGVIADEVDAAGIKELVTYGANGEVEGFQYERLTVVLLKAIQTLKAEFDAYKSTHP
jgi:Chaperone of endosialidase